MSYGDGPNIADGGPRKSAFVIDTYVIYTTPDGRWLRGQVVGPDQDYFPSPESVFVSFSSTGFTELLYVTDLEIVKDDAT